MDSKFSSQLVFDTNVLVDALLARGNYYQHTVRLLEKVKNNEIEGWVASHTLPTLYYLVERTLQSEIHNLKQSSAIATELIQEIMTFLKILPQSGEDVSKAFTEFEIDYEDFLIAKLTKNYLPNPIIISRDKSFEGMDLNIEHPADISDNILNNYGKIKIDFANLQKNQRRIFPNIERNINKVITKCNFIMGEEVSQLESQLQNFTEAKHAITCSNGTAALLLAMMAMEIQPGDEIITTPFTFIATAETIALMKALPVFVDVDPITYNIDPNLMEAAITDKTKVIMPVGLYGQPAEMDEINTIAKKYGLKIIIDGAQSFGATYKDKQETHHCDIFTTSFFPAKPLGCYGDGGAVFTDNDEYAEKIKMMRVHGQSKPYHHKYIGMGARLDTLQAAVLLAKLPHYQQEIEMRQNVAQAYTQRLKYIVKTPVISSDRTSVWAQYTVRLKVRNDLQSKLKGKNIPTAVHYPMPLHLQECFQYLEYKQGDFPVSELVSNEVMSLPMNPFLTISEIEFITKQMAESIH